MRAAALSHPFAKRFTLEEYHRLIELGFFRADEPIELICGELIQKTAKGMVHAACMTRLLRALPNVIGDRATLQCHSPITLPPDSELEPDISIVRNRDDDYASSHPKPEDTIIVIEVSDSSLAYDQNVKLPLYAEAGIDDYWIFNLGDRHLETYSQPAQLAHGKYDYLNRQIVMFGSTIMLPNFAEQPIILEHIFPPCS